VAVAANRLPCGKKHRWAVKALWRRKDKGNKTEHAENANRDVRRAPVSRLKGARSHGQCH
jgi:hypothetical protein